MLIWKNIFLGSSDILHKITPPLLPIYNQCCDISFGGFNNFLKSILLILY